MISEALIITKREIRDSLRDWRIVAPILVLTLVFPYIMNLSTRMAIRFVEDYNATIIPLRLVPFALMIVGFFPISFSLVIALETFVGEKERNSLEPLLASPLSDASLYLGKLLAAILPPLLASYLGVSTYMVGLFVSMQYLPEPVVLVQILLLTTVEALVMVSGAVVISSHTTSVRAANLLASFIIIPMAFLLQGESVLLFWGQYDALWYVIATLVVVDAIFVRMGIQTFNREEILAREMDDLDLRDLVRRFVSYLIGPGNLSLRTLYLKEVPGLLRANRLPLMLTTGVVLCSMLLGSYFAIEHPLPRGLMGPIRVGPEFEQAIKNSGGGILPRVETGSIFQHNARTLLISGALALFSFGSGALLLLMIPLAAVGFLAVQMAQVGVNPITFLGAFILPHGIVELPAAIIATAFSLRLGAAVISKPRGESGRDHFVRALADWIKVFVLVVLPLLLVAAFVEANVTPRIVLYFFGG